MIIGTIAVAGDLERKLVPFPVVPVPAIALGALVFFFIRRRRKLTFA